MNDHYRGVDIIFAIIGCKTPPILPLRQELNSNGFETVYNAKGVGEAVLEKEMRKKEEELLKKIKTIERKLESKKSYKRSKKKKRAMQTIRNLRGALEKKCMKGITYEMYLKELNLLRDQTYMWEDVEDSETTYLIRKTQSRDACEFHQVERKVDELSHQQIEHEFRSAIECMSEGDFNSVDRSSNDSSSMISMSSFGDSCNDDSSLESRVKAEELEEESDTSSQSAWDDVRLDDVLSVSTKETALTESTLSASNVHRRLPSSTSSPKSIRSTVDRVQDVKPTVHDNLTKARLLIDKAKTMKLSFSDDSSSTTSSNTTDVQTSTNDSLEQNVAQKEITLKELATDIGMSNNPRYHLIVSEGCYLSHCVLVTRSLKGLEHIISFSYIPCIWNPAETNYQIDNSMAPDTSCWSIAQNAEKNYNLKDFDAFKSIFMNEHEGLRVPILWDSESKVVLSRSANDIMRIMNFDFNQVARRPDLNLYPQEGKIDVIEVDRWLEEELCVGIHRCGQSTCQDEYNRSVASVTEIIDKIEIIIKRNGFICGGSLTAPDVRLFCILIRFDEIYRFLFKINTRRVSEMTSLMEYLRDIYNSAGVKTVSDLSAMKEKYFQVGLAKNDEFVVPRGGDFLKLLEEK